MVGFPDISATRLCTLNRLACAELIAIKHGCVFLYLTAHHKHVKLASNYSLSPYLLSAKVIPFTVTAIAKEFKFYHIRISSISNFVLNIF